jgi:hypothetical protein
MISAIKISQTSVVSPDLSEKSKSPTVVAQELKQKDKTESSSITDTVTLGTTTHSAGTYSRQAIREAADQRFGNMGALVGQYLNRQSEATKQVSGAESGAAQAASDISQNSDWGVDAVSDRILQFATAVSSGNRTSYGALKSAIDAGFQQAMKALGGEAYGVSQETYKEVIRKLDAWRDNETQSRDMFIEKQIG